MKALYPLALSSPPSPECSQAKQRASFAGLCPPALLFFFRPRWGSMSLSSLPPSATRRNREHPSPECGQAEQRAPFARVCSQAKQRAPFARVWPGGTASTRRQSVARRNSELPSPECSQAKQRASFAGMCPPTLLFLFSPPLGSMSLSSLRPASSAELCSPTLFFSPPLAPMSLSSLRPASFAGLCPPTLLFFFIRPRWGSMSLCSLPPSAARRHREHPSPECGQAERRASFARVWPGETASTFRQSVETASFLRRTVPSYTSLFSFAPAGAL